MTADGVFFEVEDLTHDRALVGLELEEFAGHRVRQAVDAGDAVADLDHASDLGHLELAGELLDFLTNNAGDLVGLDLHGGVLRRAKVGIRRRGGQSPPRQRSISHPDAPGRAATIGPSAGDFRLRRPGSRRDRGLEGATNLGSERKSPGVHRGFVSQRTCGTYGQTIAA